MTAIPGHEMLGDGIQKRLERVLYESQRAPVPSVNLMEEIGMEFYLKDERDGEWAIIPQTAYIEFYWLVQRARVFFERHGYFLNYSGDPFSHVWVTPRPE